MSTPFSAVEIRHNPTKGRALVSTRPIASGDIILTTPPLLLLPSRTHLRSACTHCLKTGSPRACTRCHYSYYCDAACQRDNWRAIHGAECKVLARVQARRKGDLPTPVRLLMQTLLKEDVSKEMEALEGHVKAWRDGEGWADVEMMAMGACAYSGKGTTEDGVKRACELMCKIQTNGFSWSDADLGQVGVFLEPTLAMMNHSCMPNAAVQVIGRRVVLRAETAIKAGDEIEISYTDYTLPKSKRSGALNSYNFQCQCPRCTDDLNVYQACAISPSLDLNRLSLAPEVVDVRQHPAVADKSKSAAANALSEELSEDGQSQDSEGSALHVHYRRCKRLIDMDMWAMAPVPQIVTSISVSYAQQENWLYALATACLVATACDPYRYAAPFHPVRVKGLFLIAKLLSNTAADTAGLSKSVDTMVAKTNLDTKVQETLREIDQVSLCQMLSMMVLRLAPAGYAKEWEVSMHAQDMLDDIGQLPGREKALSLINAWASNPESDQSQAFFKYAVVDPIHALASLGKAALDRDFR